MDVSRFSLPTFNWLRYPETTNGLAGLEPVPGWALDKVLDGAAAAGFAAVGLDNFTLHRFVEDGGRIDDLGPMLRSRGLACSDVGVLPIGTDDALAVADTLAHVASVTGAPTCIAAFFAPVDQEEATRTLQACALILSEAGARLALEFASYGPLTRLSDAVAFCDAVGWERCGVLVDTWHFFRTDAPWPALRALEGHQIALVHVNDGLAEVGDDLVRAGRFERLPVGAGSFALADFAAALDEAGYDGVLSTEVLSNEVRGSPPEAAAGVLLAALGASWKSY